MERSGEKDRYRMTILCSAHYFALVWQNPIVSQGVVEWIIDIGCECDILVVQDRVGRADEGRNGVVHCDLFGVSIVSSAIHH